MPAALRATEDLRRIHSSERGCTIAGPCAKPTTARAPPRSAAPSGPQLNVIDYTLAKRALLRDAQARAAVGQRPLRRPPRADPRGAARRRADADRLPGLRQGQAGAARLRLRRRAEAGERPVWSLDTGLRMAAAYPGACCYVVEVCRPASGTTCARPSRPGAPPPADRRSPERPRNRHTAVRRRRLALLASEHRGTPARRPRYQRTGRLRSRDMRPRARRREGRRSRRPRSDAEEAVRSCVAGGGCCCSSRRSCCSCWRSSALYVAYARIQLPETLPPIQTTYLYDRNGRPAHDAARRRRPHADPALADVAAHASTP